MIIEGIYVALVLLISWTLEIVLIPQGRVGTMIFVMLIPATVAGILTLIKYKSIKKLFKPITEKITFKALIFSIVFPLSIIGLCAVIAVLSGLGEVSSTKNLVGKGIFYLIASIPYLIITLGEEYGWRGFLLRELIPKLGKKKATIVVGVVWALYHLPAIYLINVYYKVNNPVFYTVIQVGTIFFISFSYSYLYFLSSNILLVALMHSVWNNINTYLMGDIYRQGTGIIAGKTSIINGEGVFGLILFFLFAVFFIKSSLVNTD